MLLGRVHFLPSSVDAESLCGGTSVVIDVLRATTTICHALAAGASDVRPCLEIDAARRMADSLGRERCLLGGERGGVKIAGFDLGNSPAEYTVDRVGGKALAFTTTNGTRAIERCVQAEKVLLAALVNLTAVCDALVDRPTPLDIVCAGTDGEVTREDVLVAGAIVERLSAAEGGPRWAWDDEALVTCDAWRGVWRCEQPERELLAALRCSRGGRNLVELGYDADIVAAARVDALDVVPVVVGGDDSLRLVAATKT